METTNRLLQVQQHDVSFRRDRLVLLKTTNDKETCEHLAVALHINHDPAKLSERRLFSLDELGLQRDK